MTSILGHANKNVTTSTTASTNATKLFSVLKMGNEATMIHEHDFYSTGSDSHFIQCRTCDAVYCTLCGRNISSIENIGNHGHGKCVRTDENRRKETLQ